MRRIFDAMYVISGTLAAMFLVLIGILIGSAIVGRWFGILVPSADDMAGYCMSASVFLGLAPTLRAGGHIRVTLLINMLGRKPRHVAEALAILVGIALFAILAYNTAIQNMTAYKNGEMSTGILPIPIWLPQIGMTVGVIMMLIALIDKFIDVVRGRTPPSEVDTGIADSQPVRESADMGERQWNP